MELEHRRAVGVMMGRSKYFVKQQLRKIMKKKYTSSMGKLTAGVLLALGVVFVTGCAKDAKQDISEDTGEGTRLVIRVEGIENQGGTPVLKGKAGASTNASSANNASLVQGDGFDVFVSHTNKATTKSNSAAMKGRSVSSSSNGLRAAAMPDGNAYRVFLRKSGETALVSAALNSGTVGSIPVEKGASYEWFALSFNNTTEVPEATDGSVAVEDYDGILYAKGQFDVPSGDGDVVVPLNVTFKPQLTRVAIEINTMGMFAPIASANISVTGGYSSPEAIDITTGDFEGTSTPVTLTADDFAPVVTGQGDRIAHTLDVAANSSEDISVSVTNLKITLDDDSERDFGLATMTQTFTPEPGMEQQITLGFVESPLTYGGVQWSRSPLYYEGNRSATSVAQLSHNPYRFYHKNPALTAANPEAYFSYGASIPGKLAKQSNPQDPCAFVYPAGLWRTPTSGNLAAIKSVGLSSVLEALNLNVAGTLDLLVPVIALTAAPVSGASNVSGSAQQFVPQSGINPAYGAETSSVNRLRFNYNGMVKDLSAVQDLITLNLGNTAGRYGAFWTRDRAINIPIVAGIGVLHYLGHQGSISILPPAPAGPKAYEASNALAIDLLGTLDVVKSSLMNVRCVRDSSWDPDAAGYDPNPDYSVIFN